MFQTRLIFLFLVFLSDLIRPGEYLVLTKTARFYLPRATLTDVTNSTSYVTLREVELPNVVLSVKEGDRMFLSFEIWRLTLARSQQRKSSAVEWVVITGVTLALTSRLPVAISSRHHARKNMTDIKPISNEKK